MSEKNFPRGIFFNERRDNAPEWIRGSIAFNLSEFIEWAERSQDENGRLNIDIKVAKKKPGEKSGKIYLDLNTFRPKKQGAPQGNQHQQGGAPFNDDIPFARKEDW